MNFVNVTRDGEFLAGPFTENQAFSYILRSQTKSVDLAIKDEGWGTEPAEWQDMEADALLGWTAEGTRVYVHMELSKRESYPSQRTITHEHVTDTVIRFSASGHTVLKGKRSDDWDGAGQMLDELLNITTPAEGWTLEGIKHVHRLWKAWHLNDMHAGCRHMPADAMERFYKGETVVCHEVAPGYKYGNAWLVAPIPATVLDNMQRLIRKAKGATK